MTGPRVLRPALTPDLAHTLTVVIKEEQKRLLEQPAGFARDSLLSKLQAILNAIGEEQFRETPARSRRATVEHYQKQAEDAKAGR